MSRKQKLIIDCDTGSDDAVALMTAVFSDRFDILAVTTTHGNLPVKYTTENTLRVLELLGRQDIPVYPGCNEGMVKLLTPGRMVNPKIKAISKVIDGKEVAFHDRYLDLPEAVTKPQAEHACSFLLRTLRETKEKIILAAFGPMTNIGMALRMDPSIAQNIEGIVVMGGGVHEANKSMAAESNFFNDPEAAKIVLECGAPVVVIPLDATNDVALSREDIAKIASSGTTAATFAAGLVLHALEAAELLGFSDNGKNGLHDPLTICFLLEPTVITDLRHCACDIDLGGGRADGQLLCDMRPGEKPTLPTYVAMRGDKDKYLSLLTHTLAKGR